MILAIDQRNRPRPTSQVTGSVGCERLASCMNHRSLGLRIVESIGPLLIRLLLTNRAHIIKCAYYLTQYGAQSRGRMVEIPHMWICACTGLLPQLRWTPDLSKTRNVDSSENFGKLQPYQAHSLVMQDLTPVI